AVAAGRLLELAELDELGAVVVSDVPEDVEARDRDVGVPGEHDDGRELGTEPVGVDLHPAPRGDGADHARRGGPPRLGVPELAGLAPGVPAAAALVRRRGMLGHRLQDAAPANQLVLEPQARSRPALAARDVL